MEDKDYKLVVSLKDHFDHRLDALDEKLGFRIDSIEQATGVAYSALNHRLEGMNEFRDTLRDQASRFMTRDEMSLIVDRLKADIKNLEVAKATLEGKASRTSANVALFLAVAGVFAGVVNIFITYLVGRG